MPVTVTNKFVDTFTPSRGALSEVVVFATADNLAITAPDAELASWTTAVAVSLPAVKLDLKIFEDVQQLLGHH